jgi:hypothetical protein
MFTIYCPRHQSRMLLGSRSIKSLVNTPDGVFLHWQCRCGAEGTIHTGHAAATARPAVETQLQGAA